MDPHSVLESIICDVFDALEIRSIIDSMVTDSLQSIGMSGPIQPPRLSEREIKNVTSKMELNEPTQLQDADNSKGLIITEFDQICVHKNERIRCDICTASVVCEHGALRHECSLCPSQTREASRFKVAARTITKLQRSVFGLTGVKPEIVQKFESFGRKHLKSFQTAAKKLILVSAVGRKSLVEHLQEEIQKGSASGGRAVFAILKAQGVARKIYAKQKAKKAKLLREQMHFLGCVQTVQRRWRELVAYRKSKVEKQAIANRASSQIASFWRGWHFRRYLENYKKVFKKCVSNIQRLFRERMQRKMIRLARESLVLKACLLLQKCFRQKQLDKAVLKKGAILLEMLATEISNYASTNETISDHEQILYLRKIVMYTPKSSRIAVGLIPEPEWSFVQNDLVSTKKNKTVSALAAKFGFGYARRPPARCMGITLKQLMTIFRPKKASGKVMASINRTVSTALGYLDLQNLGLSLVPTMISTCKWIKMLALRNNLLVEIPSIIGIFTLLEDLRIQDNRIATIHPALGKCINLKRILASNNNLRSLPDVFSGMTELRLLSLKSNPLVEMPVSIGALTHCLNDCDFAEFKECTFPPRKILRQGVPVAMPFMQKFYDATQSFSGYSLVASNCSILEFPPCMLSFRSLKSIDMAFNLISVIPAFVWSLLNLNSIILDSNRISIITEELRCLTNLTRLSLSDNPVEVLPASIRCMPQLIDLKTKGCPLTSPPVSIAQSKYAGPRVRKYFDAIERSVDSQSISWTKLGMATFPGDWKSSNMLLNLDVSNNDLTSVPGGVIKLLESLQVFKASRNNISSVCFELFSNPAVKLIDLSENQISKLPEAASQCRSVAVLLLNNNLLTTLPSKSMNLESLTELNLSNNCLTSIQMHWALAPSLRTLKMNGNLLTDVQTWNGAGQDTPPTRTLEFHDNRFKAIPLQVFIFLEVTKLDISMNAIKKLPMTINVLTQLTNLRISSTAISTIPDEFSTLRKLTTLDASNNNFSVIPSVIFTLTTLEKLDLSFNFVEEINPNLCFLTSLLELNLSNNSVHSYGLGCSIKNLVKLTALDLSVNKISFLLPRPPQTWEYFMCLTALKTLALEGNDIREFPWEWGCVTSVTELSVSLKASTPPEVLTAWSERGLPGIVDTYSAKTTEWLAVQYSGKIVNDTSILQTAIQCKTPGDTLAMDDVDPTVHRQSLVSLVRVLQESEIANQSALVEYKYLLSSTSEWHVPGLFLPLSAVKKQSDPDPTEAVRRKMSPIKSLESKPKPRAQDEGAVSKEKLYASGLSVSRQSAEYSVFIDPFSQIPSLSRAEDMHRHASMLQESGKIWGSHVPSNPNVEDVLEALETMELIERDLIFGNGQGQGQGQGQTQ